MLSAFKSEFKKLGLDVKQYGLSPFSVSFNQCNHSAKMQKSKSNLEHWYTRSRMNHVHIEAKKFLHIGIQTSAFNMELFIHAPWEDNSTLTYSYPNRICCSSHYSSRCQHWMLAHRLENRRNTVTHGKALSHTIKYQSYIHTSGRVSCYADVEQDLNVIFCDNSEELLKWTCAECAENFSVTENRIMNDYTKTLWILSESWYLCPIKTNKSKHHDSKLMLKSLHSCGICYKSNGIIKF